MLLPPSKLPFGLVTTPLFVFGLVTFLRFWSYYDPPIFGLITRPPFFERKRRRKLRSKIAKQNCEAKLRSKIAKQNCEAKLRSNFRRSRSEFIILRIPMMHDCQFLPQKSAPFLPKIWSSMKLLFFSRKPNFFVLL
jgi:hypothetical protein